MGSLCLGVSLGMSARISVNNDVWWVFGNVLLGNIVEECLVGHVLGMSLADLFGMSTEDVMAL